MYTGDKMDDNKHTKEYRITAAVEKDTFNIVKELALQTYRTPSQIANSAIIEYLLKDETLLKTTHRKYEVVVLTQKSAELVQNMRKFDEYYDFKANFWEICLNLSGKINRHSKKQTDDSAFADFIYIIELIRTDKPALYEECVKIMKRTLNRDQRDLVLVL